MNSEHLVINCLGVAFILNKEVVSDNENAFLMQFS